MESEIDFNLKSCSTPGRTRKNTRFWRMSLQLCSAKLLDFKSIAPPAMSTTHNRKKRRRLDPEEETKSDDGKLQEALQLIVSSKVQDLVDAMSCINTTELDMLSEKLQKLRKETKRRFMKSKRFDSWDDITDHAERQRKMKQLVQKQKFDENDDQSAHNYTHMESSAIFSIGPSQMELEFDCSVGCDEGGLDGKVTFGSFISSPRIAGL